MLQGNAVIDVHITANMINQLNVVLGGAPIDWRQTLSLVDGTGAGQAKSYWSDKRTLAASTSENLDLSGVLVDVFGVTKLFTKLKALLVYADPGNTNDVVLGGAATNPWIGLWGATGTVLVKPGGLMLNVAPDANGYIVTAGTGDLLKVLNGGAGTPVTYTIIILGVE